MVNLLSPYRGMPIRVHVVDNDDQPIGTFRADYQSNRYDPMFLDDVLIVRVGDNDLIEPAMTIAAREATIDRLQKEARSREARLVSLRAVLRSQGQQLLDLEAALDEDNE